MVEETDARILQLLERGYSYASCFDRYARNEVILTAPGGAEFRASGYSEGEAFRRVLDLLEMRK